MHCFQQYTETFLLAMHTEVTMLLIDKCGICGLCRSPRALAQEGKGKGVAQSSNHTPWRHPWLSGPGN